MVVPILVAVPQKASFQVNDTKIISGTFARRSRLAVVGLLFSTSLVVGCGKPDVVESNPDAKYKSTATLPDAEHSTYEDHEHDAPPHKPTSYPHGVAELERRHAELKAALDGAPQINLPQHFQELCDIVGWLPLLAADSDLNEAEWLPVKQSVERIDAGYRALRPLIETRSSTVPANLLDVAEREFATLRQVAESRRDRFEVTSRLDEVAQAPADSSSSDDSSEIQTFPAQP